MVVGGRGGESLQIGTSDGGKTAEGQGMLAFCLVQLYMLPREQPGAILEVKSEETGNPHNSGQVKR